MPGAPGHAACQGAPEHQRQGGTDPHLKRFAVPADGESVPVLRQLINPRFEMQVVGT